MELTCLRCFVSGLISVNMKQPQNNESYCHIIMINSGKSKNSAKNPLFILDCESKHLQKTFLLPYMTSIKFCSIYDDF